MDWGTVLQLATAAGSAAAAASRNRAAGRAAEADLAQSQDRTAASIYNTQQSSILEAARAAEAARLARAQLRLTAPETRARQTGLGDALANVQDARVSRPSHIPNISVSGGLRPSILGPNARAAGQGLSSQALLALLSGSDVPAQQDWSQALIAPPTATELPKASKLDSILNIIALLGSGAAAAGAVRGSGGGSSGGGSGLTGAP